MKKSLAACLVFLAASIWSLCLAQVDFPKALKDVVPLYPKAKLVTAVETADGSHAVLESSAAAKDILSFYKKAMGGKGWALEMEMQQKDNTMAAFKKGNQVLSIMTDTSGKGKTNIVFTLVKQ